MAKKYSRKRSKNILRKNRHKKTRRYRRNKMGGHPNENLPHWHLYVKLPSGSTVELKELFERSGVGKNSHVVSGTVGDIYNLVEDRIGNTKSFMLYWNGKKLDNRERKIRQIMVEGQKIPLYNGSNFTPIKVEYDDSLNPIYVESHDLDLADLRAPQTPR